MLDSRPWRFAAPATLFSVIALLAAGCQGPALDESNEDAEDELASTEQAAVQEAPAAGPKHGKAGRDAKGHKGGPEFLLRAALNELELTSDQRTAIEASLAELTPPDAAKSPAKGEGFAALAGSVRSGNVDRSALAPVVEAAAAAGKARRERAVAALQKLHATLTADQRSALVAAIEARYAARADEHAGKPGKGRHDKSDERAQGASGHLLRGLELRADQQAKIDAGLAKIDAGKPERPSFDAKRAQMKEALAAFAGDRFDASAMMPELDRKQGHLSGLVEMLSVVVPVLDEGQRAALADRLERGPKKHFGGGKKHNKDNR